MAGHLRLRWRGQPRHAVHQRRGAGDRAAQSQTGRDAARARVAGRQDCCPGGQPPFGPPEVAAMSRTVSPSSSRPYGLARVCRVWRASRASVYRHLSSSRPELPRRPGPVGPMSDPALVDAIRAVLTARLTDLVAASGLAKPTVRRILLALVRAGLVDQDEETRRYQ